MNKKQQKSDVTLIPKANQKEVEDLLFQLIQIESHEDSPNYEKDLADFIVNYFTNNGIESEYQEVIDGRSNVIAYLKGNGTGPVLVLNGHMDTVPPYDMQEAFEPKVESDLIYGRGSVDMKGALAAMMDVLVRIKRSGIDLKGDVVFVGTIGEEVYSPGAYHFGNSDFQADYAIIGEPTELQVGIAHKGALIGEAIFKGKSAHGSVPEQGINAIYSASKWIEKIQEVYIPSLQNKSHPILGQSTFNVGMIEGGTRPVAVPNHCKIKFEQRLLPGQTSKDVINELQQLIVQLKDEDSEMEGTVTESTQFRGVPHGPLETNSESLIVKALCKAYQNEFKNETTPCGLGFWTDAPLLSMIDGLETVVCGPGNVGQAHSNMEYISRDQLSAACRIYMDTVCQICM